MNAQFQQVKPTKATRNRVILRSYDYSALSCGFKDANTQEELLTASISDLPQDVVNKLALSALAGMVGGAMVEAHNDGEDPKAAGEGVVTDLQQDKVEFRDGVGVAMGGTLKRIARALVDLGKTYAKIPGGGETVTWEAGNIASAFDAMRQLWAIKEDAAKKTESGRATINRIKQIPEVAAKLASYSKGKGEVELG